MAKQIIKEQEEQSKNKQQGKSKAKTKTMIEETAHRKFNIVQHETHKTQRVNSHVPKG